VRRAKILLALETGANECHVMRQMHLNRGTVRVWRQRWLAFAPKLAQLEADEGSDKTLGTMIVEALTDHPRPGTPATFTAEQIVQIVAVACEDPAASGRPVSHWTPREVAEEVRKRRRLLLDSRVVDVSIAYTPTLVMLSSLEPLFFNSVKNE